MTAIKTTYKDSLFCHLFGSEDRKANALELYNALTETAHTDPDELELTTIGDVIFLGLKNDVSFLIDDEMVLWEHQSTHNPNMPLRGLHYFSRLYTKLVEQRRLDLYGTSILQLPTPRYVVFYFGERNRPEREVMRLSDSFTSGPGDLEVTATVLNCNEGRNRSIMEACETLRGYAHLVALERTNRRELHMLAQDAARAAVSQCIEDGFLVGYLTEHRAEVEDMLFTIQDEERAMQVHWEAVEREARERGMEQGMKQGMEQGMKQGMKQGMEDGITKGRKEGVAEGRKEGVLESLRNIMKTTGSDVETAMDMLMIPEAERPEFSRLLS